MAAYPFTTLEPNLGVLRDDYGNRFVVADIPGLIEGAGEGAGLGHTFLKHVDRSRFLVHLLSVEDMGEEDPFAGYALLQEELTAFDPGLAAKEQIKAVNKIDLLDDEGIDRLQDKAREAGLDLHFISALEGDGVEELVEAMWKMFRRHEGENQEEETGDA